MDILNEVMEQIRPLNEALTEKARLVHALRKLIWAVEAASREAIECPGAVNALRMRDSLIGLTNAVAEAKEALK